MATFSLSASPGRAEKSSALPETSERGCRSIGPSGDLAKQTGVAGFSLSLPSCALMSFPCTLFIPQGPLHISQS